MSFDRKEGLGTDYMLYAAGIILRGLRIHTQRDKHPGQDLMALINRLGDLKTGLGEGDIAALVDVDKTVVTQIADVDTDTGFSEIQLIDDIDGTDRSDTFG